MKVNLAGIAAAIAAVAVAAQAAPRQEDFKVQLTGVAVVADGDDEAWNKMKPLPPKTRVTVPPGEWLSKKALQLRLTKEPSQTLFYDFVDGHESLRKVTEQLDKKR